MGGGLRRSQGGTAWGGVLHFACLTASIPPYPLNLLKLAPDPSRSSFPQPSDPPVLLRQEAAQG